VYHTRSTEYRPSVDAKPKDEIESRRATSVCPMRWSSIQFADDALSAVGRGGYLRPPRPLCANTLRTGGRGPGRLTTDTTAVRPHGASGPAARKADPPHVPQPTPLSQPQVGRQVMFAGGHDTAGAEHASQTRDITCLERSGRVTRWYPLVRSVSVIRASLRRPLSDAGPRDPASPTRRRFPCVQLARPTDTPYHSGETKDDRRKFRTTFLSRFLILR
jgi:hypothetical protein